MKHTQKTKLFRWALWWGLGIMAACLAVLIIDETATLGDHASGGDYGAPVWDSINRIIYRYGIWPMVIFIGVIVPVYEEIIFRMWGNGKNWTGFTSVVLIALFSLTLAWWVAPIALAIGIAIMIVLRSDRTRRLFALMLFSSLAFALMHIGNYDSSQNLPMFLVAVLHKFGMGLLASYLVINHNLLWSIAVHILNNGLMALLLGVSFNKVANETTVVETEDYRITMQPVLTKSQMPDTYTTGFPSDSVYTDIVCPSYVAQSMIYMDCQGNPTAVAAVSAEWRSCPMMNIKVEMLGGSRNWSAAVRAMENEGWIAIDTTADRLFIRNTYDPLKSLLTE